MKEGNKTDETGKETVKRVFDNKEIINRGSHFYSLTSPLMTELQFDRLETIGDITCTRPSVVLNGSPSSQGSDFVYNWRSADGGHFTSALDSLVVTVDSAGTDVR